MVTIRRENYPVGWCEPVTVKFVQIICSDVLRVVTVDRRQRLHRRAHLRHCQLRLVLDGAAAAAAAQIRDVLPGPLAATRHRPR